MKNGKLKLTDLRVSSFITFEIGNEETIKGGVIINPSTIVAVCPMDSKVLACKTKHISCGVKDCDLPVNGF